MNLEKACRSQ